MSPSTPMSPQSNIELVAGLVVAYVSNNRVPVSELPALIAQCHSAISALAYPGSGPVTAAPDLQVRLDKPSAAQVRGSVRPDGIMSFIDGRVYKTLKRHLTAHGLDPLSYRARFGLPGDYPMVAREYAERRAALARAIAQGVPRDRAA